MFLYFILLIASLAIPFALSFDKKLHFYKQWKFTLPAIFIVAIFYIICDIYFTSIGVWGFNPRYHTNINIFRLPIEEWLFFIVVPYASIFLHDAFILYFPKLKLSSKISSILSSLIICSLIIIILLNLQKAYTVYIFSSMILVLVISFYDKQLVINQFYVTFLLILVPFLIVNAILTGSFIESEVVWYNNSENLAIRFLTIPIEDFGYAFSLILFGLLLRNKIKSIIEI
jgi:lycopene cyclase domain-containing protein